MFERFVRWFVRWLNAGRTRIPSGVVLPADEYMPGLNTQNRNFLRF